MFFNVDVKQKKYVRHNMLYQNCKAHPYPRVTFNNSTVKVANSYKHLEFFFSIWVFLSRPFANHKTAGEGGEHFLDSSLPLPPASQALRH